MAGPKTFDRTRETTTTTGTGAVTLAGAASGYRAFSDVLSDGDTCLYAIVGGTEWETGVGTFTLAGTTLTRTTVLASSNAGAAVNLSAGTKDVWIDHPAALLTYFNPTAAYASLAAYQQGRLAFPSNGFNLYRDSGSALVPWGPLFPLTEPINGDFSWVNQGGSSVDATKGGVYLLDPANAGLSVRLRVKSAPATPYTITTAALTNISDDGSGAGVCFRASGSGAFQIFGFASVSGVPSLVVQKFDSPTTFNSSYLVKSYGARIPMFMRIADDGANRICSTSHDGQNFVAVHSIARTDFLTADQVGIYAVANNGSYPAAITLLSWKEA